VIDGVGLAMRSLLACNRVPGRAGRALRGLLGGVWLGLLDEGALRRLDERYYEADRTYRSAEWNARGLDPWEREAVQRAFAPGQRIAVAACGGGREVLALVESGYDATGYESHEMLRAFGECFLSGRGLRDRVRPALRDSWPESGACDGAVVGWGALSLISPRPRRQSFLAGAAAAVAPGGRLVLSCFEQAGGGRELRLVFGIASRLRALRRAAPVEAGDAMAPNLVHLFTREELSDELQAAGWRLELTWSVRIEEQSVGYLWATAARA
jgi:hypothetical protein